MSACSNREEKRSALERNKVGWEGLGEEWENQVSLSSILGPGERVLRVKSPAYGFDVGCICTGQVAALAWKSLSRTSCGFDWNL